ncbi:terminase small subunit [Halomonas alimentaria]|uniref:Terminase small subunit n=1 Tax=Halomonas alimentaria TaxID=147248 RepID=A0A7X4W663_9GAMM|nr:terminase small subunit [Halomonas alimentaria]NAW35010.1 terminase small subunit [Halomonas alimentaria]
MAKTTADKGRKLTVLQQAFVEEYLVDLNAYQAAVRAGYAKSTARKQAPIWVGKNRDACKPSMRHVWDAIQKAKAERSKRTQVDADYVLNRLHEIDQLDVLDILNDDGSMKPIKDWPKSWRTSINGLDVQTMMSGDTEAVMKKIKWPDKAKNLDLLGRHVSVNAWNPENSSAEPTAINIEVVNPHAES